MTLAFVLRSSSSLPSEDEDESRTRTNRGRGGADGALIHPPFASVKKFRCHSAVGGKSSGAPEHYKALALARNTKGRDSAVVARCQDIHGLAVEHLKSLGDYGVTTSKLANLQKKIDGYTALQAKPRQAVATSSAATSQLKELFAQANSLLTNRLDGLAWWAV